MGYNNKLITVIVSKSNEYDDNIKQVGEKTNYAKQYI